MTYPERRSPKELLADGALAGDWTLDPAQSTIKLSTRHAWGMAPVKGVFRKAWGEAVISPDGEISGKLKIGAASIDTAHSRRDAHLRSDRFLAVGQYPDITFALAGITPAADQLAITGFLTVRDRTLPISFPARLSVCPGKAQIEAEVPVNRGDFGLTYNILGMAGMKNTITVRAVFTTAPPSTAPAPPSS
jgi:polyisoprenoid-binding protein YceI